MTYTNRKFAEQFDFWDLIEQNTKSVPNEELGTDCLVWTGAVGSQTGYPQRTVRPGGIQYTVSLHRWVLLMTQGDSPPGAKQATHDCGNRRCLSKEHLNWGSARDNQADRIRHGRGPHTVKITQEIADQVRDFAKKHPWYSQRMLGQEFGLSQQMISRILLKQSW